MAAPHPSPPPVERVLRALADTSRRRIVERLSEGPASVSALAAMLDVTLTAVAQHLQVLEEAQLVRTEKAGRVRTATRDPAGFALLEHWLRGTRTVWERRLDALGDVLDGP